MNPDLSRLHPYPFEKLAGLLHGIRPPGGLAPLNLSIGEPRHPVPEFLRQATAAALDGLGRYPTTRGEPALSVAIGDWLERRFGLPSGAVQPSRHFIPVNGTREALYSIALAVVDRTGPKRQVLMPNPFYQIYEGATLMAGGEPYRVDAVAGNGFLPDYAGVPAEILDRTALLYLCSPGNPTGAVVPVAGLTRLLELAERHDFVIAADECYSEIWYDAPPPGLLQAAWEMGWTDFRRCLVFHSLSKRSNMPGARSGFVAGDAEVLGEYFRLRTYTGCAMPPFVQKAAIAAWGDEGHVEENRGLYRKKLDDAIAILTPVLPVARPEAGFYLWLRVPGGGEAFARRLFAEYNVTVLPGAYLGREGGAGNPGAPYVRIALVATVEENRQAMERIASLARSWS
nr:Aminotransferase [uncultured bacterium]